MKYLLTAGLLTSSLFAQPTLKLSTSEIKPETRYELVFDQAVVSKDKLNLAQENKHLKISPPLSGALVWTARNVAQFQPSKAPKLGTKYRFSTSRGLTHLDGSKVPVIKLAEKSTPHLRSDYHRRYSKGNNRKPLSYLRFNDDVSAEKLSKKFYYINKAGVAAPATVRQARWSDLESSYYVKPSWAQRFDNVLKKRKGLPISTDTEWEQNSPITNGVIVSPSHLLSVGEDWTLVAKKGIPNTSTSAKTKDES